MDCSIPFRHDLWPFFFLDGQMVKTPPSLSCYRQSALGVFSSVSLSYSVTRDPTATLCFFLHRGQYHTGPLAPGCLSPIAYTWGLRWYLIIIFFCVNNNHVFFLALLSSCFVCFGGRGFGKIQKLCFHHIFLEFYLILAAMLQLAIS